MNIAYKIKTLSACNFKCVRSPIDFSQQLPIESAASWCLCAISRRWLIVLPGRYGLQDVLRPRPQAPALAASWLCAGTWPAWPQAAACPAFIWRATHVPKPGEMCSARCEHCTQGDWEDSLDGQLGGSFVLGATRVLQLFGSYQISTAWLPQLF